MGLEVSMELILVFAELGWGSVFLEYSNVIITDLSFGTIPGEPQPLPRAEFYALLELVSSTTGSIEVLVGSSDVVDGYAVMPRALVTDSLRTRIFGIAYGKDLKAGWAQ